MITPCGVTARQLCRKYFSLLCAIMRNFSADDSPDLRFPKIPLFLVGNIRFSEIDNSILVGHLMTWEENEVKNKTVSLSCHLVFGFEELGQGNHAIIVTSSFLKSSVFKMFSVHLKTQTHAAFLISSGSKSVFETFSFRAWLVCTVSLTVDLNLHF